MNFSLRKRSLAFVEKRTSGQYNLKKSPVLILLITAILPFFKSQKPLGSQYIPHQACQKSDRKWFKRDTDSQLAKASGTSIATPGHIQYKIAVPETYKRDGKGKIWWRTVRRAFANDSGKIALIFLNMWPDRAEWRFSRKIQRTPRKNRAGDDMRHVPLSPQTGNGVPLKLD